MKDRTIFEYEYIIYTYVRVSCILWLTHNKHHHDATSSINNMFRTKIRFYLRAFNKSVSTVFILMYLKLGQMSKPFYLYWIIEFHLLLCFGWGYHPWTQTFYWINCLWHLTLRSPPPPNSKIAINQIFFPLIDPWHDFSYNALIWLFLKCLQEGFCKGFGSKNFTACRLHEIQAWPKKCKKLNKKPKIKKC